MDQEITEKLDKVVKSANNIAIILPDYVTVDCLCAGIALQAKFQRDNKKTTIFTSSRDLPKLSFLNFTPQIHSSFGKGNELVLKVMGDKVKPTQLRYEKSGNDLLVYVGSTEGVLSSNQVEVLPPLDNYDLFIIIGATNLESLGTIYFDNTEKFFQTPKVCINNDIEQEYFANLTWVELEATSICEQLSHWFGVSVISQKNDTINTSLLAGIIAQTGSFKDPKTTPESLLVASSLVNHGARQQEIIQHFFKTKPFNILQLWGRALARIKTVNDKSLYTILTKQDFEKTQSTTNSTIEVLKEIVSMTTAYHLISVIAETSTGIDLYIAGQPHIKLSRIAKQFDQNYDGASHVLVSNYHYITLKVDNHDATWAEKIISELSLTGI